MKAILLQQAELTSISARVDKSVRFSICTGELTDSERAAFFPLQGANCRVLLEPLEADEEPVEVKGEKEQKTPSQRLRGVLWLLHKQLGSPGDFEEFYRSSINRMVDQVKAKLDPA